MFTTVRASEENQSNKVSSAYNLSKQQIVVKHTINQKIYKVEIGNHPSLNRNRKNKIICKFKAQNSSH